MLDSSPENWTFLKGIFTIFDLIFYVSKNILRAKMNLMYWREFDRFLYMDSGVTADYWNGHVMNGITSSSFNGSLIQSNFELMMFNEEQKGDLRLKFIDMKIITFYRALVFPRFHHLYQLFNDKMMQLTSGGLFDLWLNRWTKSRYNVEAPPPADLVVLSMEDLGIGFKIWLIMLLISTLSYIGEIIFYYGPKVWRLMLFKQILRTYFKSLKISH